MRAHRVRITAKAVTMALVITATAMGVPMSVFSGAPAAAASSASGEVEYRPPSDAPIVDHYRPPATRWGAGNRGIDYGTEEGDAVRAAADGRVVFAGEVGGALHVTVEHADHLRTTYSFLASTPVARGDRIHGGDVLGVVAGPFHFGVRTPDGTYLDPELVLAGLAAARVVLVPGADEGIEPLESRERGSLLETLGDTGAAAIAHLARTGGEVAALVAHGVTTAGSAAVLTRMALATARWVHQREHCTPASVTAPRTDGRRIAIEVSGLGTSSSSNSAWEFDTATIGYADADVLRFSYRGGRVPGKLDQPAGSSEADDVGRQRPQARGTQVTTFTSIDSQQPVGVSADRLSDLIDATAAANPGVPIDVLAHSQGGVVARLAIERAADSGRLPDTVSTLVTVGSPHAGAPLATGASAMQLSPTGRLVLDELRATGVTGALDDRLPATADLAATSELIREVHTREFPDRVRFISLGGSGDLIVPGVSTVDPEADDQRILPTSIGTASHGDLTSDARTTREISMAVSGLPLTCQSLSEAAGSFLEAQMISLVETSTTLGAAAVSAASPLIAPAVIPSLSLSDSPEGSG